MRSQGARRQRSAEPEFPAVGAAGPREQLSDLFKRLCLASARGDAQGAAHWIQYGDVDWRDTAACRSTALMYAAAAGHADVAMALLKARACPLLLDAQQRSAADLAKQARCKMDEEDSEHRRIV